MKRARPKEKRAKLKQTRKEESRALKNTHVEKAESVAKKPKKEKKSARKKIVFVIILVLIALLAVLGLNMLETGEVLAPVEDGKVNVLLLGVDEDGLRGDTIMVASYDIENSKVNMLSIPRDTKIRVKNMGITRKINSIHAISSDKKGEIYGATAIAEVVTQLTGIPINYYVEFSFASVDGLFDILGPVEFDVPDIEGKGRGMNYDDPVQNLSIHLEPGLQKLSGNQIQQFLRYRKSNYGVGTGSDTDRISRQQDLVKEIIEQKVNLSLLFKLPAIFATVSREVETNVAAGDITKYLKYAAGLSAENVKGYSLPGESKMISGASYYVCDIDATKSLIKKEFGFESDDITDTVTLSDDHSQKVLKGGNMDRKLKATEKPEETKQKEKEEVKKETEEPEEEKVESTPTPSPSPSPTPTVEPTKEPEPTEEVKKTKDTKPTTETTPKPTKTPLEDLDDEYVVID